LKRKIAVVQDADGIQQVANMGTAEDQSPSLGIELAAGIVHVVEYRLSLNRVTPVILNFGQKNFPSPLASDKSVRIAEKRKFCFVDTPFPMFRERRG